MSIDDSGLNGKVSPQNISIEVYGNHPLVKLANTMAWDKLSEIALPDIKATTKKGKWWMGRPLRLRIHMGAYLLQQLFNKTDRQIEYDIKDNAAYQLFCGCQLVKKWHCPDHTKIQASRDARDRFSPSMGKINSQYATTFWAAAVLVTSATRPYGRLRTGSQVTDAN